MTRKKAVVYTRVSTDKEEQKLSLEMQREVYTEYCERENLELVEIFADEGFSGTNARREKFIEMMYRAGLNFIERDNDSDIFETATDRKAEFDYIITKDVSRYARNEEIGMSTAKQLRKNNVYIRFEHGGVSTEDKNWKIMLSILFSVAEGYSSDLSEKIKFTKEHNARKLRYRPSRLPYGYTWDKDKNIVIVPDQAKIVKRIYDNYTEKGSMIMTKELNAEGIKTQRGHEWSSDKITRIIKNPIYTGTAVVHRTYKEDVTDTKRKHRDVSEYIIIPNAVPLIISEEQHEEANVIRESRINKSNKRGRKVSYNDVYFQKIQCSICGRGFKKHSTAGSGNKKKINYMCMSRVKSNSCGCRGISLNNLNKGLDEITINYLADSLKERVQYKELMVKLESEIERLEDSKNEIQSQIDQLDIECDKLLDSIQEYKIEGNGNLVKGFEKKFDKSSQKREVLEAQLESMSIEKIQKLKLKVERKKELIEQLKQSQSFTNEEKLKLLQKVVVSDYELEYFFNMPNYDDEIQAFNGIFMENPIETNIKGKSNGITVKRNHKEARDYWEQVEEDRQAYIAQEADNQYQDEEMLFV